MLGRGRIGPFGCAEVGEGEVHLLVRDRVRVGPQGQHRGGVPELVGDPTHALARGQGEPGPGVPGAVELQGPHTHLLDPTAQPEPSPLEVVRVEWPAGLAGERPFGNIGPAPVQRLTPSLPEQVEQHGREPRWQGHEAALAVPRRRHLALHVGAAHVNAAPLEVHVLPPQAQELAAADAGREEHGKARLEAGFPLASQVEQRAGPASRRGDAQGAARRGGSNRSIRRPAERAALATGCS